MKDGIIGLGYAVALMIGFGATYTALLITADWVHWAWLALIHDPVIARRAFQNILSRDEAFGLGMMTGMFVLVFIVVGRRSEGRWPHEK